jgi:N-acyl-D-amino-acid deacylase
MKPLARPSRRQFTGALATGLLGAACAQERPSHRTALDYRIRNALIVDGTGSPAYHGDLGIQDGRFVPPQGEALLELNVEGLAAAPGFVDIHSHGDLVLPSRRPDREALLAGRLAQGITTEVIGNCGLGAAPVFGAAHDLAPAVHAWMTPEGASWQWQSLADYSSVLETRGLPLNVAALVPHGLLRLGAMGLRPGAPDAGEQAAMTTALEQSLEEGAYGLSCGLIYPPGMFSATSELLGLAGPLRASDGVFTAHVRGSSETLLPAVEELIGIGRAADVRVHHSHAEAVGRDHWSKLATFLGMEREARREGVRISADMFPYPVAATMMYAIYPPWALEGGPGELLVRLRDPETRARIGRDIEERTPEWPPWEAGGWPHNLVSAVGWDGIQVSSVGGEAGHAALGRSLRELGNDSGTGPFAAISDLMLAEDGAVGQFVLDISGEEGLRELASDPAVAFITDANDYGKGSPHPAAYGAFPRVLRRYVREAGAIPLEEAIRRMTSLPADIVGLADRGRIANGLPADLVLFDKDEVTDHATLDNPRSRATGIRATFVNGQPVIHDGRYTGALPGRVLRKPA